MMPEDDAASNEGDWRSHEERARIARTNQHLLLRKQRGVKVAKEAYPEEEAKFLEDRKAEKK